MKLWGRVAGDTRTGLMDLPMTLLWSSISQESKQCFSNRPTTAQAAVSLNAVTHKPNESLYINISCYGSFHYTATDKTAHENTDPMRIHHCVSITNNTTRVDKIAKQVCDTPQILQGVFLEGFDTWSWLKHTEDVYLRKHTQAMQVSVGSPAKCSSDDHGSCIHQV